MEHIQQFLSDILPQLGSILGQFFSQAAGIIGFAFSWLGSHPVSLGAVYTQVIRWIMPVLAAYILLSVLRRRKPGAILFRRILENTQSITGNAP